MSDVEFERRVATALHAPVTLADGARDRIMCRVRESAARTGGPRRRSLLMAPRATRHSILGLAMAASVGSVAVITTVSAHVSPMDGVRSAAVGDSIVGTLRDTLLLMRLIRDGEHRYAFVVDGARWAPERTVAPAPVRDRLVPMLRVDSDSN